MSLTSWKKISIGRADLMVPPDTKVLFNRNCLVNQIQLSRVDLKPGETFVSAWNHRLKVIESGKGAEAGVTRIRKSYPGSQTDGTTLYEESPDQRIPPTLERWQQYGTHVYRGITVVSFADLRLGEQGIHDVFTHLTVGTPAIGPDDYVFEDAVIHLHSDGNESTSADLQFDVPSTAKATTIYAHLSTEVLADGVGSVTVLARTKSMRKELTALGVRFSTHRNGPLTLSGLTGLENVTTGTAPPPDGKSYFSAEWQSGGLPNNNSAPETELTANADTRGGMDPALLLQYWDGMSKSLHFR